MHYYIDVLKKYAVFSGRARRKEYWMFVLFNVIFAVIASILDGLLGTTIKGATGTSFGFSFIYVLYILAVLIPSLAVGVRRLHDTGRSGWMMLVGLIPIIGAIWLFVLMVLGGNPGENKYGPNPKQIQTA